MKGVDELIDTTACGLAKERPVFVDDGYQLRSQCTRKVLECDLAALLEKHQNAIEILAEGLKDHKEAVLARMSDLCTRILEDPHLARGRNCTWYLGDLVIALEAPADAPSTQQTDDILSHCVHCWGSSCIHQNKTPPPCKGRSTGCVALLRSPSMLNLRIFQRQRPPHRLRIHPHPHRRSPTPWLSPNTHNSQLCGFSCGTHSANPSSLNN